MAQAELGRKVGLSRGQISNLEAGNRKMDLDVLRRCARALDCHVVDLLLPEDAPDQPNPDEAELLRTLRASAEYDAKLLLIAAKGVIDVSKSVIAAAAVPRSLAGDPALAADLTSRWNDADENQRAAILQVMEAAQLFRR